MTVLPEKEPMTALFPETMDFMLLFYKVLLMWLSYISGVGNAYSLLSIRNSMTSSTEHFKIVHRTPMV